VLSQAAGAGQGVMDLTDDAVADRIISHLMLTFIAERPPPPQNACQEDLMAADIAKEYFCGPFHCAILTFQSRISCA
jgi:hypothetical protein